MFFHILLSIPPEFLLSQKIKEGVMIFMDFYDFYSFSDALQEAGGLQAYI